MSIKTEVRETEISRRADIILKGFLQMQDEIYEKAPDLYKKDGYYEDVRSSLLIRRIAELEIRFEEHLDTINIKGNG